MKTFVHGWLLLCAIVVLVLAAPIKASSHSMYQSAVLLDFFGSEIHTEIQLPLERVETVFGKPISLQMLKLNPSPLANYVLRHFDARYPDGRRFRIRMEAPLAIETVDDAPYVVAHLVLRTPDSTQANMFQVDDHLLLDSIRSQVTLVSIRSDWNNSVFANDPQLVGIIRIQTPSLTIDRTGGSWFNGFSSVFRLGLRHIAEGTDHLLFLLALLLPAPLLASGSHWTKPVGMHQSLLRIVKVVTAFTVGHSITLALASLGVVRVPSRPIETLIAVSILVSALHALRPLFPGREAAIAAFFGLIHGLAFAATISGLGLDRWERVVSILGFNLGIETMQLVVIVATMPSLVLLSRTRMYPAFRIGGALFAGVASLGWIAERLFHAHLSVDRIVDGIAHQAIWIAAALFLISVACWSLRYRLRQLAFDRT